MRPRARPSMTKIETVIASLRRMMTRSDGIASIGGTGTRKTAIDESVRGNGRGTRIDIAAISMSRMMRLMRPGAMVVATTGPIGSSGLGRCCCKGRGMRHDLMTVDLLTTFGISVMGYCLSFGVKRCCMTGSVLRFQRRHSQVWEKLCFP